MRSIDGSPRPFSSRSIPRWIAMRALWALLLMAGLLGAATPTHAEVNPQSTTDHSVLPQLQGPFESGRAVTRACLSCHTEAGQQLRQTTHWNWDFDTGEADHLLGKRNVFNAFCGSVRTNLDRCTSCHIGYGWMDPEVTEPSDDQVDCLVCHEQTGDYQKFSFGYTTLTRNGRVLRSLDLVPMAQSVGPPTRANCGYCHFHGGAMDGAKHGDLDSSLIQPPRSLDVHMDREGLNFDCVTCHAGAGHQITGSRYQMLARDSVGIDRPGHTDASLSSCESCHGQRPHPDRPKLNDHADRVACQTCHIPLFARGGRETKLFWDWSTAGQDEMAEEAPETDANLPEGRIERTHHHGTLVLGQNQAPDYFWFDGRIDYMALGDHFEGDGPINLSRIFGSPDDRRARIWPFKVMRAILPYDPVNNNLVINHLSPVDGQDADAFYRSFDWSRSVAAGMRDPDAPPWSGEVGFIETLMYFPITHMVAPKEEALGCDDCHSHEGRLAGLEGFYLPGRDGFPLLSGLGWMMVILMAGGIAGHGALRYSGGAKPKPAGDSHNTRRELFFSFYERFWHWSQAALILGLLYTGFHIAGFLGLMGYEAASLWHRHFAWALIMVWILTLFWMLVTGEWRQYILNTAKIQAMVHYYMKGIFNPDRYQHPFKLTKRLKHNPLQRFTYLILSIIVTPIIWVSGLAYLYFDRLGGDGGPPIPLEWIAGLHLAVSFVLLAFLVIHVYMAFMNEPGRPATEKIVGMWTGYIETPVEAFNLSGRYQILVVEDDPDFSVLIRRWLKYRPESDKGPLLPANLTLANAATREEGISMLRKENYDLVLLDLGLPDSQGLDTFLAFHWRFPETPVLVMTGDEEEESGARAVHEGAQDYLSKPELNAKKLARAIRYALERDYYAKSHAPSE